MTLIMIESASYDFNHGLGAQRQSAYLEISM